MTADLSALPGLRLVLLANRGVMPARGSCALCGALVLPGAFMAALAYSDRRAGLTCPRCARDVDPVVAELVAALCTVGALIEGLEDDQHRSGLAHGLDLLVHQLTDHKIEGGACPISHAEPGVTPSSYNPNPQ